MRCGYSDLGEGGEEEGADAVRSMSEVVLGLVGLGRGRGLSTLEGKEGRVGEVGGLIGVLGGREWGWGFDTNSRKVGNELIAALTSVWVGERTAWERLCALLACEGGSRRSEWRQEAMDLMAVCADVRVQGIREAVIQPLLSALSVGRQEVAMVWMSLLKFFLLLPISPMDPGEEGLVEGEVGRARLREVAWEVVMRELWSRWEWGRGSGWAGELERWVAVMRKAEEKAVERAGSGKGFVELRREVLEVGVWGRSGECVCVCVIVCSLVGGVYIFIYKCVCVVS